MNKSPESRWSERLELGEGARWVDGRLVLVDIFTGRLLADDGSATLRTLAEFDMPLGAVAPIHDTPNTWIAAAGTGICILMETGEVKWIGDVAKGLSATMRVNDAAADAAGRFWFGTMTYDAAEDAGSLYRVDQDGSIVRVLEHITVPNGPVFNEAGTTMYLADSARDLVRRYSVDPVSGELGEAERFVDLAGTGGSPDGMTVDSEGGLWIACWGSASVRRFLPDGTPDRVIEVPAEQPASVCLGGPDGRLLHITTATYDMDQPGPYDGAIFTVSVDVPGFPTAAFRPSAVER